MSLDERLTRVVCLLFNDASITVNDSTVPQDIPGWDSLATVNLLFALEQEFDIQFSDAELGQFGTIGELKAQIAQKIAN